MPAPSVEGVTYLDWEGNMRQILLCLSMLTVLMTVDTGSAQASSATYYFSSSKGSDGKVCTRAAPCRSLAKIQSLPLAAGDSVAMLRGDTWTGGLVIGQSGSSAGRISFYGYGTSSSQPRITRGQNGDCFKVTGKYVQIDNLEGYTCGYAGAEIVGSHVTVKNSQFVGNAVGIQANSGISDVAIVSNKLLNNNILNVNNIFVLQWCLWHSA